MAQTHRMPNLDAALAQLGYAAFRPGQREAIETLLATGRLLLIAPTGGGKSLVYQLPALLLPGTTLVISPLVALMHDQVQAVGARGIPATFLASTLAADELRRRMAGCARRAYRLVYVAPERLVFAGFRGLLRELRPPLIAVDEAHCISEWGHDFRPEYLQIGALVRELPGVRLLACTATATPIVRDEILAQLGLDADTPQIVRGFARPNLALRAREVRSKTEGARVVDATLAEALAGPGEAHGTAIVYASTRRATEEECERLAARGWSALAYHAGLAGERRDAVQVRFQRGEVEVVVATNAFGMGIDRPDVRAVIHLGPPGSLEAFYQEVGRAGRDGAPAIGLLLVSPQDLPLRRRLLEQPVDGVAPAAAVVQHKWGLFLELLRWAEGGSCRHDALLRYFGDEAETLDGCGRCDVCTELATDTSPDDPGEIALIVRKALSGVARFHGRFGLGLASKLLRGVPDARLARTRLDRTPTFGILAGHADDWVLRLLRRLVVAGWVDVTGGDRPVVRLTDAGRRVMRGEAAARLLLPPSRVAASPAGLPARRDPTPSDELPLDAGAQRLFAALRALRLTLARQEGVPPYVVASDRALRELAHLRPRTVAGLTCAHGIGPAKAAKYGAALLGVLTGASADGDMEVGTENRHESSGD